MKLSETVVDGYFIQVRPNRDRSFGLTPGVAVTFVAPPGNFILVVRDGGPSCYRQHRCNVPDVDVEQATAELLAAAKAADLARAGGHR